jgi:hypothetical protein
MFYLRYQAVLCSRCCGMWPKCEHTSLVNVLLYCMLLLLWLHSDCSTSS